MDTSVLRSLFHKGKMSEDGPKCRLLIGCFISLAWNSLPVNKAAYSKHRFHTDQTVQHFLLARVMIISCLRLVIPLPRRTFELPFISVVPFRPELQRNTTGRQWKQFWMLPLFNISEQNNGGPVPRYCLHFYTTARSRDRNLLESDLDSLVTLPAVSSGNVLLFSDQTHPSAERVSSFRTCNRRAHSQTFFTYLSSYKS